ncbi:MAG: M20/M25/M40 family metallo-hydrolase [SAR202 cluster bacterium]|nr:M20/M25/M40 family metallo-hydrolase [SAR202 cluster bacterium]
MAIGTGLTKHKAYLEQNKDRHIKRIQKAVQQPSVSTEDLGVRECAQILHEMHKEVGFQEAEIIQTPGLPGLWSYYDAKKPKTIVVYGNFDTRPVLPHEKWDIPPYSGAVASMGGFSKVLVGRGSYSYKGPYVAWLNAIESMLAVDGTLPVNVMTLLEGDEILGSPYYRDMYNKYKPRMGKVTASFSPGASQDASGRVGMSMGSKGMIYADLIASGAKWGRGPQGGPLHGMTKSVIDSPVWRLVHALSTLTEPDGNRIVVKGFYDALKPPTAAEKKAVQEYIQSIGGGDWKKVLAGVAAAKVPAGDLPEEQTILNYYFGPSLNINGIKGGFTGPGTLPFSLPHQASARFDIRVPRGYKVQNVIKLIRDHLDAKGYSDVEFKVMGAFDPSNVDPNSDLVRSIKRAFQTMGVPLVTAPCSGGGGPWSIFATDLGVPMVRSVGVGGGGGTGGPNEFLVIDGNDKVGGLVECELSHIHMLKSYAEEA